MLLIFIFVGVECVRRRSIMDVSAFFTQVVRTWCRWVFHHLHHPFIDHFMVGQRLEIFFNRLGFFSKKVSTHHLDF